MTNTQQTTNEQIDASGPYKHVDDLDLDARYMYCGWPITILSANDDQHVTVIRHAPGDDLSAGVEAIGLDRLMAMPHEVADNALRAYSRYPLSMNVERIHVGRITCAWKDRLKGWPAEFNLADQDAKLDAEAQAVEDLNARMSKAVQRVYDAFKIPQGIFIPQRVCTMEFPMGDHLVFSLATLDAEMLGVLDVAVNAEHLSPTYVRVTVEISALEALLADYEKVIL